MPVILIMVFVLLFALTVGVLIWKILTGKEGRGSAEGKIYISKKGVYSESEEARFWWMTDTVSAQTEDREAVA